MTDPENWYTSILNGVEYVEDNAKLDFAVTIERQLQQQHLSRSDFARKINKSPAYVTKILRGDANLTLANMARLTHALGCTLHIHVASKGAQVHWRDSIKCSTQTLPAPITRTGNFVTTNDTVTGGLTAITTSVIRDVHYG